MILQFLKVMKDLVVQGTINAGKLVVNGPITGENVTSGNNPGHTHSDIVPGTHVEGGSISATSDIEGTVTFATPFADTYYSVVVTMFDNSGVVNFPVTDATTFKVHNKTANGFDYILETAAVGMKIDWLATETESSYTAGPIEEGGEEPEGGEGM